MTILTTPFRVTSPYGPRVLNGQQQFHDGVDLVSDASRDVWATVEGTVVYDKDNYDPNNRWTLGSSDSGGNMVILSAQIDGRIYYIRYLHLETNNCIYGQHIRPGYKLGVYGDVGYSFGAHLHVDAFTATWQRVDVTPLLGLG